MEEMKEMIVAQLPTQVVSEGEIDGKKTKFITVEEAIKEILEIVRSIKKTTG